MLVRFRNTCHDSGDFFKKKVKKVKFEKGCRFGNFLKKVSVGREVRKFFPAPSRRPFRE
jgi:hypothetical protein